MESVFLFYMNKYFLQGMYHYNRTEFPWRPKTAKEYRKTATEMFVGGAPSSMDRHLGG
jgi:hypothetical protein